MTKVFIILAVLFGSATSWGYANFIGYGYTSCATCHYNSFGNGPLNDYGRALWATEIAGRLFHSSSVDEETLGNQSGFLGSVKMPNGVRPSISYRGLNYASNFGNSTSTTRFIHMQADFGLALLFGARESFAIVGSYGYAPRPQSAANSTDPKLTSNWISREHYIRVQLGNAFRVFVGMMDKVYGIRIPDHNTFSRSQTGLAQNDQAHGAVIAFSSDDFEFGLNGFAGNMFQDADLRQAGGSMMFEVGLAEKWRLGASVLSSSNKFVGQNMAALHTRVGAGKGSSIMTELGVINRQPKNDSEATMEGYALMQNLLRLSRGLHFLTTFEYYTQDINKLKTKQMRFTPGIQWFPAQRIEMRMEAMNSRSYDPDNAQRDVWDLLGQIHLYF